MEETPVRKEVVVVNKSRAECFKGAKKKADGSGQIRHSFRVDDRLQSQVVRPILCRHGQSASQGGAKQETASRGTITSRGQRRREKKTSEFRSMNGPIQLDQTVAANNFWGLFHFGEARCSSRPARQQETAETCNRSPDTTTRAFTSRKANCRCQPPGQPTGNNWPNSGFVLFFFRRTETSSDAQRTGGVRPIVAANDAIVCSSTNAPRLNARE